MKALVLLLLLFLASAFGDKNVSSVGCQHQLIKIVYGKPSPKLMQLATENKVYLGGCMRSEKSPKYYCTKCKKRFK